MVEDGGSPTDDATDSDSTVDAVFEAVADERRRLALYYLRDRRSADLAELATVVSGWTRARRSDAELVTPGEREEDRVELHHVHLPRLADAGFVSYDRAAGTVRFGESSELLAAVLDRSLADERRWASERSRAGDGRSPGKRSSESERRVGVEGRDRVGGESRDRAGNESRDRDGSRRSRDGRTGGDPAGGRGVTLRTFVDDVAAGSRTLTVFAPERDGALARHFETRGVTVDHEPLPDDGSGGFVVVTADGEFVGSLPRRAARELVSPDAPDLDAGVDEGVRLPMNLLADTTFVSFDRRQMLAASREIEDRAYRQGRGTLRAGFQSLSTLESQRDVYELLIDGTDLDVHLYGNPDWEPAFPDATVHAETADEIGRFWFVVFDGGGDVRQACALLAEEVADEPGSFRGFWTYDPDRVADLDAYLAATY